MIYFIRNENTGRIKIGYSHNPITRVNQLQTGCDDKLRLLLSIPGSITEERLMQDRFKHCQHDREWYNPDPLLLEYINSHLELDEDTILDYNFNQPSIKQDIDLDLIAMSDAGLSQNEVAAIVKSVSKIDDKRSLANIRPWSKFITKMILIVMLGGFISVLISKSVAIGLIFLVCLSGLIIFYWDKL